MNFLKLFVLFTILSAPLSMGQSATSEKILSDMLQALGGQAFLDVKDTHSSGRFFSFKRGSLSGSDLFEDYIKFPDMERTEFGVLKNKTISVNRGNEGWTLDGRDLKPQSAAQVEDFNVSFKTSFDYVTRFVLNQPRTTLQVTNI